MTASLPKRKLDLGQRGDSLLDPLVDLLLAHGNQLAEPNRWGANPTGYFCLLNHPIDFDLVEQFFDLPSMIAPQPNNQIKPTGSRRVARAALHAATRGR